MYLGPRPSEYPPGLGWVELAPGGRIHRIVTYATTATVKICSEDNKDLTGDSDVMIGPVNNLLHSMFTQVDVYLNQKLVSPPNNAYAYRSYIETLLNYGPAASGSHLTSSLWYLDTAGYMDSVDGFSNHGLTKRPNLTEKSKHLDLIGHLSGDIFNQGKFLINGVELRIKLVRARENFVLMTPRWQVG